MNTEQQKPDELALATAKEIHEKILHYVSGGGFPNLLDSTQRIAGIITRHYASLVEELTSRRCRNAYLEGHNKNMEEDIADLRAQLASKEQAYSAAYFAWREAQSNKDEEIERLKNLRTSAENYAADFRKERDDLRAEKAHAEQVYTEREADLCAQLIAEKKDNEVLQGWQLEAVHQCDLLRADYAALLETAQKQREALRPTLPGLKLLANDDNYIEPYFNPTAIAGAVLGQVKSALALPLPAAALSSQPSTQ